MDTHPEFEQISLLERSGKERFKVYGPAAENLPDSLADHAKKPLFAS